MRVLRAPPTPATPASKRSLAPPQACLALSSVLGADTGRRVVLASQVHVPATGSLLLAYRWVHGGGRGGWDKAGHCCCSSCLYNSGQGAAMLTAGALLLLGKQAGSASAAYGARSRGASMHMSRSSERSLAHGSCAA